MRVYKNFREALSEVRRDLGEMGIIVKTKSYQNKNIDGNSDYDTKELQNYIYQVTQPNASDLNPTQPWADLEFAERLQPGINPGDAWKERKEVWEEFFNFEGKFDYTYSERYHPSIDLFFDPEVDDVEDFFPQEMDQISAVVDTLANDMNSRQAYLSVWNPKDVFSAGGNERIPCSLGYLFQIRRSQLNVTYLQRSSDFVTHFVNDVYLTHLLQKHIVKELNLKFRDQYYELTDEERVNTFCQEVSCGTFTHWIGSLHAFRKDLSDVF